jgi:diguanylate cyclase (GGDEF)-like protein
MTSPLNPARILLVEDEFVAARDLQLQLTELDCACVGHATRGEEALRREALLLMPDFRWQPGANDHAFGQARAVAGRRKDGSAFALSLSDSEISRRGKSTFIGITRDLSQQQRNAEEIHQLAFHDRLTTLSHRGSLMNHLNQTMLGSARSGQHAALPLLDLDHFKHLNDTLGLAMGDQLLQQVATRLKSAVRDTDPGGRLGGDGVVVRLESLSPDNQEPAALAHAARVEDLQRGLARQEFALCYQIQVDPQGEPFSAEALVRWIVKMKHLKALGVTFSLDDFGTEFSSLSIQRDLLACVQCDAFQGYYFGRPVLAEELPGFSATAQAAQASVAGAGPHP